MAYTKKVAPKKSKNAVKKKVTAKKIVVPKIGKVKKVKPLLNPISPKKSTGVKLPPLSEKEKGLLGLTSWEYNGVEKANDHGDRSIDSFVSDFMKGREISTAKPKEPELKPVVTGTFKITVRNVTEHTLKRVRLFDNDFMNQQDVHYSTAYSMQYKDFMRRKNAITRIDAKRIINVHISSNNTRQVFSPLYLCNEAITGVKTEVPYNPVLDPFQYQAGVVHVKHDFFFDNALDIFIDFLDPDTRVTYTFTMIESE